MIFDLHIHTSLSPCGRMEIGDVLARAKVRGLDGICITDHNTMNIRHVLSEGVHDNGLCVIFGMEYSTTQGDFLVFGPFEEMPADLSADRLLRTVQNCGGIAVAAHPFRKARPVDERLIQQGLCGAIESRNGRNTPLENLAVALWRQRYDLTECGGSDAHTLAELGTCATRFSVPIHTRMDLIQALNSACAGLKLP
jgi:predicted metal-dependent phosphoesterase TrpH